MNVIAWELGDKITDFPDNVSPWLARAVQSANDVSARAYGQPSTLTGTAPVPPEFSMRLLELAHETMDTLPGFRYEEQDYGKWLDPRDTLPTAHQRVEMATLMNWWEVTLDRFRDDYRYSNIPALLNALEEYIMRYRVAMGMPAKRLTAPSVADVNSALRKMAVKS